MPYARATALFAHFTGSTFSRSTVRRTTVATAQAVQRLTAIPAGSGSPGPPPILPMQVSVDGSMLAILGEGWREVRVASLGLVTPDPTPATVRTTQVSYTAALCDAQTFQQIAMPEVVHRGLAQATHVAAVSDGATWIQDFIDYHCPQAVRILDFAHAAGYLAAAAQASFGPGTAETSEWFVTQRHELRHGAADRVLAALGALPTSEERTTALRYLGERRPMLTYRSFAEAGWPVGSGSVESAHKHVLQVRMKGPGMRWGLATAQAMIALRVVLANERWEQIWPQLAAQQRHLQQARREVRRPVPAPQPPPRLDAPSTSPSAPAPAPPKLVQQGKPTANHPWRRPFIRRCSATDTKM